VDKSAPVIYHVVVAVYGESAPSIIANTCHRARRLKVMVPHLSYLQFVVICETGSLPYILCAFHPATLSLEGDTPFPGAAQFCVMNGIEGDCFDRGAVAKRITVSVCSGDSNCDL
jgi:hypothetical protein